MVVLKRLTDAVADGDPVLAVVRGSAVNQDGRSNGLMAPNPAAQMDVLRAAYANAGIEPRQVDYVEAHATGTLLGDPIEARALGRVLGRGRPESAPLLIGSVKPSLGHLDAAAGIAGFIKAVLAVQRGRIPANLNFENPNPHIPFDNLRLKVVDEPTDWPATGQPRRAGVSSFGFGGTNAHVVVEQRPDPVPAVAGGPESASAVTTLVVGGKTAQRVASAAGMLAAWMDGEGAGVALAEVAHTVNHHRARHAVFATVAALDREQAVAGLRAVAAGGSADGVVAPHRGQCRAGTVFVYSGQGSQWAGMGRQLLADEPVFAAAVAELEPVFVEQVGFSLQEVLAAGEPVVGIERIQPVLVAMGLALTELWRSYGVQPDAVIGHSMGEVTAAVVAKALTPRDGLRIIATRGDHAALADLAPQRPRIPIIAATGAPTTEFNPEYWATSSDDPVFSQAVAAAGVDYGTFVEISPHPVLTDAISDTLGELHHHSIGTLQRDTHDTVTFHTNLNATYTVVPPATDHPAEPHPAIPTAPWHHTRHWIGSRETPAPEPNTRAWHLAPHWLTINERLDAAVSSPRPGTLLGAHVNIDTMPPVHLWQAWLKPDAKPYPGDHLAQGVEVVPVAVLLHTLSAAASECGASALSDVRFEHEVLVDQPRVIQVLVDGESVTLSSGSTADSPTDRWITHVVARLSYIGQDEPDDMPGSDLSSPTEPPRTSGIGGQPFGWSIDACRSAPGAVYADVDLPGVSTLALLDAAVTVGRLVDGCGPQAMLPVAAECVRLDTGFADSYVTVKARRRGSQADDYLVDIVATAPDGTTCVDIRSLRYAAMEPDRTAAASPDEAATVVWSQIPAQNIPREIETRLQAIIARELGTPAAGVDVDRSFPELGFDSVIAMSVLREAKRSLGFEVSATLLWDHPTISSLSVCLAELLAKPGISDDGSEEDPVDSMPESAISVLDELFDNVESASAGSESGNLL